MAEDKPQQVSPQEAALQALLAEPTLETLDQELRKFNQFILLGIDRDELSHSRVVASLLNPRGTHGLGDLFLRAFLTAASAKAKELRIGDVWPEHVNGWQLGSVKSIRERNNIDVLVVGEDDQFVCLIENKISSSERPGQLAKYWKIVDGHYKGWPRLAVFLTPRATLPIKETDRKRWTPLCYGTVADIIDTLLNTHASFIDNDVGSFLRQYTTTIRRRVVGPPTYLDLLSLDIYKRHPDAINRINLALDNREKLAASVGERTFATPLEEASSSKLTYDFHVHYARSFDFLSLAPIFPPPYKMVSFQVKYEGDVKLYVWIRGGNDTIRKRLLKVARANSPPLRKKASLNKGWTWIYQKQIISKHDDCLLDFDETKRRVEHAIREFCETDYYPLVNAIRAEFGLPPASPT